MWQSELPFLFWSVVLLVLLANISNHKDNCINEHTMIDSFVDSLIVFNLKFLSDFFVTALPHYR